MEKWQARKKLNRDPAAFTSLRVACRYSSRPPSYPLKTYLSRTRSGDRVLLLFTELIFAFYCACGRFAAATYGITLSRGTDASRQDDKICHSAGDKFLLFCRKR
jgi:hypothetical protein